MSTTEPGPGLRMAQTLGLTATAFLAGKIFSQSVSTTPSFLLAPPPLLARQWKRMFNSDKIFAPIVVLYSGSVFGTLAHRNSTFSTPRGVLYVWSAALMLATLPYSQLLLHPLNNKLEAKAAEYARMGLTKESDVEMNAKREETVHYLVDQWAILNLGRSALVTLAAILATWAKCRD